ncbi:MAG: helix-turn-helix domain-containing protein [Mesorhizobium sp.]
MASQNSIIPEYRLYRETPDENADFWVHCETIPARAKRHNWEIATHRHPSLFQLFHIATGSGEILGGGTTRQFDGPCVLFIPPSVVHGFRFTSDIDGLVVTALSDRLANIASGDLTIGAFAQAIRIVTPADGGVASAFARLAREAGERAPGRAQALDALISLIVVDIARLWRAHEGHAVEGVFAQDARFERLSAAIDAHFRQGLSLADYADLAGLSPSQLNRIARRVCGLSVQEMVARRIVQTAQRDLVFTPTPVVSIAQSLGFADPAYFNRFFRAKTGMTPGAFREQERAKLEAQADG